jgi:hypothetical protein
VGDVFAYREDASAQLPTILCDHFALEFNGSVTTRTIGLEDALAAFAEIRSALIIAVGRTAKGPTASSASMSLPAR